MKYRYYLSIVLFGLVSAYFVAYFIDKSKATDLIGSGITTGAAGFCDSEPFCTDYESDPGYGTYSGTDDCNLDTDDDYCKQYATEKVNGNYGMAMRGDGSNYADINLTASYEGYWQTWFKIKNVPTQKSFGFYENGVGSKAAAVIHSGQSNKLYIYTDAGNTQVPTELPDASGIQSDTWYHIIVYICEEASACTGSGPDDGIIKVWLGTTLQDYEDTPTYTNSSVDTGTGNLDNFYINCHSDSGEYHHYDDTKVFGLN